jgi:hypothetical protein
VVTSTRERGWEKERMAKRKHDANGMGKRVKFYTVKDTMLSVFGGRSAKGLEGKKINTVVDTLKMAVMW